MVIASKPDWLQDCGGALSPTAHVLTDIHLTAPLNDMAVQVTSISDVVRNGLFLPFLMKQP